MGKSLETRPLVIGEVLFDEFPDGTRVLGGAPFNVAWNLQGLGLEPLFVSAVGADDEGREVLGRMDSWGMDTSAVQVTEKFPTGKVEVELQGGEPRFHILADQAYDDIRDPEFDAADRGCSLLYQGSLAFRSPVSRSTIRRMMSEADLPRFVDINIRDPWFDRSWATELLDHANWIKLNVEELSLLAETECGTEQQIAGAVGVLRDRYHGRQFLITCGASGAYAIDQDGSILLAESPPPDPFIDAVGAGDAFAAASIAGINRGLQLSDILATAVRYASDTCTIQGGTTMNEPHYALPNVPG